MKAMIAANAAMYSIEDAPPQYKIMAIAIIVAAVVAVVLIIYFSGKRR